MKRTSSRVASPRSNAPSVAKNAARKKTGVKQQSSFSVWCSNHELLCFAVVSAVWVMALYWNAMKAPFVYDDLDQIVNNPSLRSWHAMLARFILSPVSFTTEFGGGGSTYRPLFWLTLMLDRQIWGAGGASGFHFTNLLFHWANGAVLYKLLRRLSISTAIAAMAAIVWLGLPIHTEVVAWVSARAYLLSTFFILSALLFAHLYLSRRRPVALGGYFALAIGAVFSHEQGVVLVPLTLLLIYVTNRRDRGAWMKLSGAALVAAVLYIAMKYRVGTHTGQGTSTLWSVGLVFWRYILWMLAPLHMSIERSTSLPQNTASLAAVIAWAFMLALPIAAFLLRRRIPAVAAGILCGFVALLPFCGFVPIYQGMAERFLYLASVGFTLSLVAAAVANRAAWKGVTVGCLLVWMTWGAWRLRARIVDWDDPVSLYRSSLEATPNSPLLYYNLGSSLRERGTLDDALDAYREAVRLQPRYPQAFASIGEIYARRGSQAEAIKAYDQALALQPNDASVVLNKAVALQQAGSKQLAEVEFKRAIALAPKYSGAYVDLASLYAQENREDEAGQYFQKAIDANPDDPTPYFDLAVILQQKGRDEEALAFYRKVLRLKPDDPDTLLYMSKLHVPPGGK
jgi:protein O-mannosyl-transferase